MDLQEQLYITTIADCGSITRAAAMLHISQPALSRFLTITEQRLGYPLFQRSKTLVPTELGTLYLEKARQILRIGQDFRREAALLACGGQALNLQIGVQTLRAPRLAPCIYMAFSQAFPQGHLQILDGARTELIEKMNSGQLDLVLTNDVALPGQWERFPLRQDRLMLVSGLKNPPRPCASEGDHTTVDLRTLKNRTFLMLTSNNSTYVMGKRVLAASGIQPAMREGAAKHEATLNMIAMGEELGFTFDSYLHLFHLLAPVRVYNILQEPNIIDYVMCCKPDRFPGLLKEQLRQMLSSAILREGQIQNSQNR